MSTRAKTYVFAGLLLVLALVWLRQSQPSPQVASVLANQNFKPMDVQDPTLRLEDIEASRKREYEGKERNIFSYGAIRQPIPDTPRELPRPIEPPKPPEKPPLVAPFKFYGVVTNPATGRRRAFFTNGEEIWIAEEGQMIERRFRLVRIGAASAEVEEVSSGERVTLPLEEPPGSGS